MCSSVACTSSLSSTCLLSNDCARRRARTPILMPAYCCRIIQMSLRMRMLRMTGIHRISRLGIRVHLISSVTTVAKGRPGTARPRMIALAKQSILLAIFQMILWICQHPQFDHLFRLPVQVDLLLQSQRYADTSVEDVVNPRRDTRVPNQQYEFHLYTLLLYHCLH